MTQQAKGLAWSAAVTAAIKCDNAGQHDSRGTLLRTHRRLVDPPGKVTLGAHEEGQRDPGRQSLGAMALVRLFENLS